MHTTQAKRAEVEWGKWEFVISVKSLFEEINVAVSSTNGFIIGVLINQKNYFLQSIFKVDWNFQIHMTRATWIMWIE